ASSRRVGDGRRAQMARAQRHRHGGGSAVRPPRADWAQRAEPVRGATLKELTWAQVIGRRLQRHHLLKPAPANQLVQVVSDICGVHAQVAASAELMLGLRVTGITREDVREELWGRRTLVKTVGLRGT